VIVRDMEMRWFVFLVSVGLAIGIAGCRTTDDGVTRFVGTVPPVGPPKLFNLEELTVAVTESREQGKREGIGLGRMEIEPATREAFNNGVRKGAEDALKRASDEARQRSEEAQRKLSEAATNFLIRTSMGLLLNAGSLRAEKAATMQAWQVLDLVSARLTDLGYKVRFLVPSDKMALVRQYETARVYLAVSERFRARFVENFERMSVRDAVGLLHRLYGFEVWVGEAEPVVWLGYFNAGPDPIPNMALELRFDEERFERRSYGR
jgi:hypothetical protein